ncbi:MAG: CPBP family intramembrane metalloprotease [Deltaproteobacteria bacterium]|nr:CPBP family intramembrane metalloprotease [Deltaproteobacteria bacterium]
MDFSKQKSLVLVAEGFFVVLACQALGGLLLTPELLEFFPSVPLVSFLIFFSLSAFFVAILYLWKRTSFKPIYWRGKNLFFCVFAGMVAAWLILFTNTLFIGNYSPLTHQISSLGSQYFYPAIFILFVLGPCLEEIFYRGYLFEIMKKPFGDTAALVFLSFLFMFGHFVWSGFTIGHIALFFYSIIFTLVYIKGGLIASISVHAFLNFCLFIISNG